MSNERRHVTMDSPLTLIIITLALMFTCVGVHDIASSIDKNTEQIRQLKQLQIQDGK